MCRLLVLTLVIGSLAGCKGDAPAKGDKPKGPPAARVSVAKIAEGGVEVQWSFLGDVRALRQANLAAGSAGEVRKVLFRVGDRVKKGELLVDIDPSLAAARLQAARASTEAGQIDAEQAARDAARVRLAGPDVVSSAEIEQAASQAMRASAERARLKASVGEARAALGRHRVRAPFDGVIARRDVDPGDWVNVGDPVVTLVDHQGVEVLVGAPPEVVTYVKEGDKAILEYGGKQTDAVVQGLVPALDPTSRTVSIRLTPVKQESWLLAGSAVDVKLGATLSEVGAVTVPRDALVYRAVGRNVVRVVDGKVMPVDVEIVAEGRNNVLVKGEGLAVGQELIVRGNERVRPGQPVSIIPES